MTARRKLKEEDERRVQHYLEAPMHQNERPPFRPLYFTLLSFGSVTFLLLLAVLVVRWSGIE